MKLLSLVVATSLFSVTCSFVMQCKHLEVRAEDEEKAVWSEEDLETKVKEAIEQYRSEHLVKEPWRKDVRVEMVDNDQLNSEKVKKLKIYGIPENVKLNFIRLWTYSYGTSMSGSSVFSRSSDSGEPSDVYFNEAENCYEFNFTPVLDSKNNGCRHFLTPYVMKYFRFLIFLKEKSTNEAIDPIEGFVSNVGLKQPENLQDFREFNINFVKDQVVAGKSRLEISGIPKDVKEITVRVEKGNLIDAQCDQVDQKYKKEVTVSRDKDGKFASDYQQSEASGEEYLDIRFSDAGGYEFLICENVNVL